MTADQSQQLKSGRPACDFSPQAAHPLAPHAAPDGLEPGAGRRRGRAHGRHRPRLRPPRTGFRVCRAWDRRVVAPAAALGQAAACLAAHGPRTPGSCAPLRGCSASASWGSSLGPVFGGWRGRRRGAGGLQPDELAHPARRRRWLCSSCYTCGRAKRLRSRDVHGRRQALQFSALALAAVAIGPAQQLSERDGSPRRIAALHRLAGGRQLRGQRFPHEQLGSGSAPPARPGYMDGSASAGPSPGRSR